METTKQWLSAPYKLHREDNKAARFYWVRGIKNELLKYIGITSFGSKVVPISEELIRWKLQRDPDGVLVEKAADHGTLEHKVIDRFDRGLDWKIIIPKDYPQERMVFGSTLAWHKFRQDFKAEIIASEIMLKWEHPSFPFKCFAATLDKVAWLTRKVKVTEKIIVDKIIKERVLVAIGVFKSGKRKGEVKHRVEIREKTVQIEKEEIATKEQRFLAIIDLKSNWFEKDKKNFYESHQFQLWGQKLAFMQAFPDMPEPELYNWSSTNWRTRSAGFDDVYTLKQWKDDYSQDFNDYLSKAHRKGWLQPNGKIEVFADFDQTTPIEKSYMALTYDEYVEYREKQIAEEESAQEKSFQEIGQNGITETA